MAKSLFSTATPVSTYGYGPVSIRLKLKPGTRFKIIESVEGKTCKDILKRKLIKQSELNKVVVARFVQFNETSFLDYIVCSPQVISSWSYGTPEHYDEIHSDVEWRMTHDSAEWDSYVKMSGKETFPNSSGLDVYETTYGENYLKMYLSLHRSLAKANLGQIFFAEGEKRERSEHFATNFPIYFNQR